MSFQILNKLGEPISIGELDKEACAFWNKEVHPKQYANPAEARREDEKELDYLRRSMTSNWFDVIGWNISNQGNYTSGWRNVVHTMIADMLGTHFIGGKDDESIPVFKMKKCIEVREDGTQVNTLHLEDKIEESIYYTMEFYKPFIELINHWMEKGYTPKQIKE